MCVNSDCVTQIVPIAWFWNSISHTTLSWTALHYLFVWLFYMLISLPEMIFWVMFMAETKLENDLTEWLLNMWISYPALYGSWVFYAFGVIWPAVQLGTLSGINQPGYTNAAVHLALFLISWLFTGIVHVLGFPAVNRKFLRENGHEPGRLPAAKEAVAEEKAEEATEDAAAEATEDAAAEAEDTEEDAAEDAEDAAEDAADDADGEADDAFKTSDW